MICGDFWEWSGLARGKRWIGLGYQFDAFTTIEAPKEPQAKQRENEKICACNAATYIKELGMSKINKEFLIANE